MPPKLKTGIKASSRCSPLLRWSLRPKNPEGPRPTPRLALMRSRRIRNRSVLPIGPPLPIPGVPRGTRLGPHGIASGVGTAEPEEPAAVRCGRVTARTHSGEALRASPAASDSATDSWRWLRGSLQLLTAALVAVIAIRPRSGDLQYETQHTNERPPRFQGWPFRSEQPSPAIRKAANLYGVQHQRRPLSSNLHHLPVFGFTMKEPGTGPGP